MVVYRDAFLDPIPVDVLRFLEDMDVIRVIEREIYYVFVVREEFFVVANSLIITEGSSGLTVANDFKNTVTLRSFLYYH